MNVKGWEVPHHVIDELCNAMRRGPFGAKDIEYMAVNLGAPNQESAMRLADRLIQRERKAHRIHRTPCTFTWHPGERPNP